MTETTNRPIAELRDGGLSISVWRAEPKEEGDRPRYDHKFSHRYFNKKANEWQDAGYSSGDENLRIANLYMQAYNKELELRAADRQVAKDGPSPA